jgi:hypothetical protein
MAYRIVYSSIAEKTFLQNIAYLEKEWTIKEVRNFLQKTQDILDILKSDPHIFSKWERNTSVFKVIVVKQITMFYAVEGQTISILLFWNNYQDPGKLAYLLY